ncbi:MAG: hypothetical protein JSV66_08335 [Trueperaceae bacterium]|nr:MAG: hypothetical protein JSV66_08335 [Trueperaceae bacterium]
MAKNGGRNLGIGIALICLGGFFLLVQAFDLNVGSFAWPFFIIIPGLLLFGGMAVGGKSSAGLAVPGSIVTTVGLILFVQNLTGHFESWSYAWALIPTAVGVGLVIQGGLATDESLREQGLQLARIGVLMFLAFGVFFEMFIFQNFFGSFVGRVVLPLLLIGGGAYLLLRNKRSGEESESEELPDLAERPPEPGS